MQNENRTPEQIERDIERERMDLKQTINGIQDRFSVDGVVREVSDQLREHGGDIGRTVSRSVKENPMALALTGVGLAWMIFGQNRPAPRSVEAHRPRHLHQNRHVAHSTDLDDDDYDYDDRVAVARTTHTQRPARPVPLPAGPEWSRPVTPSDFDDHDEDSGPGMMDKAKDKASAAGDAVKSGLSSAGDSVANAKSAVGGAASSAASSTSGAAGAVRNRARGVYSDASARARLMRERMAAGTESLSEEARERVIAARERAMQARDDAARALRNSGDKAADFYEDHPLVVGAFAFAIGAAVAGALPRTRTEDEYLGSRSDELFDEAERIFETEKARASKVADAALKEAKTVISDTKADIDAKAEGDKNAAKAVGDKAKDAAERVKDAAADEADNQNLGGSVPKP